MNSFNALVEVKEVELNPASGLATPTTIVVLIGNPVQTMFTVVVPGVITAPPLIMNGTSTVGVPWSSLPIPLNVQLAVWVLAEAGDEVDSTLIAVAPASIPVPSAMVATALTTRL
jgi:hypothetical protein